MKSNYEIVKERPGYVQLKDLGPWDEFMTITNNAEQVVEEMLPKLKGRRLLYTDSEGELTELIIKGGVFVTFAPGQLED